MTIQPPPEFVLAAACCCWPRTAENIDAIRKAAAGAIDWRYFMQLVGYHRVAGLVQDGLKTAGVVPPQEIERNLAVMALSSAHTSLKLAEQTVRLQRAFDQADIAVLFLKGAALGQRVYGSWGLKYSWDIDLFVSPPDIEAAVDLLEREGYGFAKNFKTLNRQQLRHIVKYTRELPLQRADDPLTVEMSWRPAYNRLLFSGMTAPFRTQQIVLPSLGTVRTLCDQELAMYLCVHGAAHAWNRLKWLADLHALLAQIDPLDLPQLYRTARQRGCALCVGQALLLCERIFAYRLPGDLSAEWRGDKRLRYLTKVATKRMTMPTQNDIKTDYIFGGVPMQLYGFLLGRGWTFLREQFRIHFVRGSDVVACVLPPRLFFLYPILRIPFFLWRRIALLFRRQPRRHAA